MDPEGRAEAMREHRLQPRKTGTLLRMAIFLVAGFQLGCTMATQLEVQKQNNGEPAGVGPRLGAHLHLLVPYYDHPLARDAEPLEIPRLTALHHCPAPSSWSLRKVLKRQVIVARASRSFCKPVHWTKLKPSYKGSTPISSVSFSRTSPPAHEQASWHGTREMWQKSIGTPCVPKQTNTCKAAGWCNGRTGRWLTPVGDDMQASPEHEMAAFFWWTQTSVPWRPHPLRASQFQLYASRVTRRHRRIARWTCNLQPLSLIRAWIRHRPCAAAGTASHSQAGRSPDMPASPLPIPWAHNHISSKSPRPLHRKHHSSKGQPGPKSGASLSTIVVLTLCQQTSGVRVVPDVVAGTGPASAGKQHGDTPVGDPALIYLRQHKRAFRRARTRAESSPLGGTYYKGRWHTPKTLNALIGRQQPANRKPKADRCSASSSSRQVRPLRLLCWNASSLSGGIFQEFMTWLDHHHSANQYHLVVLQETHWKSTADFNSGQWQCIHSSGYDSPKHPEKSSGILVLASRKHLQDLSVKELFPGRLLQLQATLRCTNRPLTAFVIYQHVWRTHLTTAENHNLRGPIWQALEEACAKVPSRNHLLVAGDFNSTLKPQPPYIGHASTPSDAYNHSRELQQLVVDLDLCVLNTFNSKPRHTYYSTQTKTQIDFVLQRRTEARGTAFSTTPLHDFPVGAARETGHKPLHAEIPLLPFGRLPEPPKRPEPRCNMSALQQAVQMQTAQARALLCDVQQQLEAFCPVDASLCQLHSHINAVLLRAAQEHFPSEAAKDNRISADPRFKASATHTWQLYRSMRRPGPRTLGGLLQQWRQLVLFRQASRALRQQSRQLKREFYQEQISAAERADSQGDQRALFQIVKRLGPRSGRCASRLLTKDGHPMTSQQQLEAIVSFSTQAFASKADAELPPPLEHGLDLEIPLLQHKLSKVGIRKAVPPHIAPAAMWRLCSDPVGALLGPALNKHYSQGQVASAEGDWKNTNVIWLPKPHKKPITVASMRPIGLQSPATKSFASALKVAVMEHLQPVVRDLPQYAYLPHRGTTDALLKVHQHFERTAALIAANRIDRFQQKAGKQRSACVGGVSLSLDLSSAFDGVHRPTAYHTMLQHGVDRTTVNIIQSLHQQAQYHFTVGGCTDFVCTTNGIKQGCTIAPSIWAFFTVAVMLKLVEARSMEWLQQVCTLFADDCWGSWLIRTPKDVARAVADIAHIIAVLEDFHLSVNYQKTAVLLRLEGKQAAQALADCTVEKEGNTYLEVDITGVIRLIPIKSQHEYLGTTVSYHHRQDNNTAKRMQAGQLRYQDIRRILNGRHVLTIKQRTSLWRSCIYSSLIYSLPVVGLTPKSNKKLYTQATRHLRAIARQPAHLHHTPNRSIWEASGLQPPAALAQQLLQTHRDKLAQNSIHSPDITNSVDTIAYVDSLLERFGHLPIHPLAASYHHNPDDCTHTCPQCQQQFPTENAMRIHCKLQHSVLPEHSTRTPTDFIAHVHAKDGLPQCSLCLRRFYRWGNLKAHIRTGACEKLGGDAAVRYPAKEVTPAEPQQSTVTESTQAPPTPSGPKATETEPQQSALPLVLRPTFHAALHNWERQLSTADARKELAQYCVLCGMWIADNKHVKQHHNKAHHQHMSDLQSKALVLCTTFKAQLRRDSSCRFCGVKVGAPGRHSQQCAVLFQLCIAVSFCRDGRHRCSADGGHLPRLLPQRSDPAAAITCGPESVLPEQEATTGVSLTSTTGGSKGTQHVSPQSLPSTSAIQRGSLRRYLHSDVSSLASPRGATSADQAGPRPDSVRETGSAQHPPSPLQSLSYVEREKGESRQPGGRPLLEDCAALLCHSRTPVETSDRHIDRGWQGEAPCSRLDQQRGSLALSTMVRENQTSHPRRGSHPLDSRQRGEIAHLVEGLTQRRHHPQVCGHPTSLQVGGSRAPECNILPGSVTSRQRVRPRACHASSVDQQLVDPPDRNISETRERPALQVGPTSRGTRVPRVDQGQHNRGEDTTAAPVPSVSGPQRHPPFRLANPGNHCYLNAYLYSLWVASYHSGVNNLLPQVAGDVNEPVLARHLFGFQLLGWPRPEQQHDIAELIDFLNPRLSLQHVVGQVECRQHSSDGVAKQLEGSTTKCIRLLKPSKHSPNLQDLINFWFSQDFRYALSKPDPWLFLQLPRFAQADGRISKGRQAYHCTHQLDMPIFTDVSALQVRWAAYQVVGYIQHHGRTVDSGHYTMVQACPSEASEQELWQFDDEKSPCLITAPSREKLQRNMYILVLALTAAHTEPFSCSSSHVHSQAGIDTEQSGLGGHSLTESGDHYLAASSGPSTSAKDHIGYANETADLGTEASTSRSQQQVS